MKNYLFYSVIMLCLAIISCDGKYVIIASINNNSGVSIDSVQVWIAGSTQTFNKRLSTGEKEELTIDFSNVPKNDGLMRFKFFKHGGKLKGYDIYYSNGISIKDHHVLEILPDTIKMVND